MKTISVCMIVKDEELTLDRILSQVVQFADELIVVDTGSQDNSKEIAKKYTNKVYDYEWQNDFSKARNHAFSYATMDYIMWLDADDYIPDSSIRELNLLKQYIVDSDVVMLPYIVSSDEFGNATFSYFRERIVKNNGEFLFSGFVHEAIVPKGKIMHKNIPIMHKKVKSGNPRRNLDIYLSNKKAGVTFSPRQQFYFACEYYYNELYGDAIIEFEKFLTLPQGYVENKIQACLNLMRIYKIREEYDIAIKMAYRSFLYDTPRPEILVELGNIYLYLKDYIRAIYWYRLAIQPTTTNGGFKEIDSYGYIPLVQIGLCYYYLGDYKKAYRYNHRALKYKPFSTLILDNEKIYLSLLDKNISSDRKDLNN